MWAVQIVINNHLLFAHNISYLIWKHAGWDTAQQKLGASKQLDIYKLITYGATLLFIWSHFLILVSGGAYLPSSAANANIWSQTGG